MLTYSFEDRGRDSLYEFLYKSIRDDILSGKLKKQELTSTFFRVFHLTVLYIRKVVSIFAVV